MGNMSQADPPARNFDAVSHPRLDGVVHLPTVDSTNLEANRLRLSRPGKNVLIISDEQTAGIGQHGRNWESPRDVGLWMTLLIQDPESLKLPLNLISIYTGIILQEVLQQQLVQKIHLKWPNDIMVRMKKLGGILTELKWFGSTPVAGIIGIGLNIKQDVEHFSPGLRARATSLYMEGSSPIDTPALTQAIVDRFFENLTDLRSGEELSETWNQMAWKRDETVLFFKDGKDLQGLFRGIDSTGNALIQQGNDVQRFISGEIRLGRQP